MLTQHAVVVDAVLSLDQDDLNEKLIGIKKITGGALQDSLFVNGVAFKKTFSYAGFEQQPKSFVDPKIVCLNVELELKSEKDNAEVRVDRVSEYQAIVDAEWQIIYNKMEALYRTGAKVVLSKLPIGDLATQLVPNGRLSVETLFTKLYVDILRTATFSVLAECLLMIWSVWYKQLAAVSLRRAQISDHSTWVHASVSRNDKSVAKDSTFSKVALQLIRALWYSGEEQNNLSQKSKEVFTTPS